MFIYMQLFQKSTRNFTLQSAGINTLTARFTFTHFGFLFRKVFQQIKYAIKRSYFDVFCDSM